MQHPNGRTIDESDILCALGQANAIITSILDNYFYMSQKSVMEEPHDIIHQYGTYSNMLHAASRLTWEAEKALEDILMGDRKKEAAA